MSEIVKSMPLHGRMSHDVLHQPLPDLPPKRSTSAGNSNATGGTGAGSGNGGGGGFLSSITRKLSHPHLKDSNSAPNPSTFPPDVDPVAADISLDYFVGAAPTPPASHHSAPQQHESPKLGSSFSSRSWLHPFGGGGDHHQQQSKNDNKALPQIPQARSSSASNSKNNHVYGDPFSASSTMSLPGFLHRSPRKDSLSSDKSEQSSK